MVGNHHFHPFENGWLLGTRQFIIIEQLSFHLELAFPHPELRQLFIQLFPPQSCCIFRPQPRFRSFRVINSLKMLEEVGSTVINSLKCYSLRVINSFIQLPQFISWVPKIYNSWVVPPPLQPLLSTLPLLAAAHIQKIQAVSLVLVLNWKASLNKSTIPEGRIKKPSIELQKSGTSLALSRV